MSSPRLNLRMPQNFHITDRPNSERPSSRTDKLVEASFSSDNPAESLTPKLASSSSTKTLSSASKLKDLLQKTSDKLKGIQSKSDPIKFSTPEQSEKSSELLKLRREVRILEMEKKDLEIANKKLQNSLNSYKNAQSLPSDANSYNRYTKYFLSAVKEDPKFYSLFKNVFNTEDEYYAKAYSENLTGLSLGLFQFSLDTLQYVKNDRAKLNGKDIGDEALKKMYFQTQNIAENILNQKARIEQAYENVRDTIEISRLSVSPSISRPQSSASVNRRGPDTPKQRFTPLEGFREKTRSWKESDRDNLE